MSGSSSPLSNLPLCQVGFVVCDVETAAHCFAALLGTPLPEFLLTVPDTTEVVQFLEGQGIDVIQQGQ